MRFGDVNPTFGANILSAFKSYKRYRGVAFAISIISVIAVLIFPVPTWLIDFLLSISITFSVLILMTVVFIERPLDFNTYPTVLLVVTMLRLALNISTTRLILSEGHNGTRAAGRVIEAFGSFVMQGSVVIGVIVFAILTIINFVVITKGSGRIAEVAARFSLDAMPGKQMAIDADLSSGLIDETTARTRRSDLEDESAFFGNMDGANKFVRGDAVAGIMITFINLIGGIVIGVLQRDMTFDTALQTYTMLTIGDGLVSQIPALVVSTSAGLLVTKSGSKGSTEKAIFDQFGGHPKALGITSGLLFFMGMMPGLPIVPFFTTGITIGVLGYYLNIQQQKVAGKSGDAVDSDIESVQQVSPEEAKVAAEEALSEALQIDILKLELGYELLPLINSSNGPKIIDQIRGLRQQIATDLGFIMPSVRIKDNVQLEPNMYVVKVKDIEHGRGEIKPHQYLVMESRGGAIEIPGETTREPAFGLPAKWIDEEYKEDAVLQGYTVVDPSTVVTTHLTEIIKDNITELLSYMETQKLLDALPEEHQKLVAEIIPGQISVTILQRVLQGLLNEGISIRDLSTILEAISESSDNSDVSAMTEHVRSRLAKQICHTHATDEGYIPIVALSPTWEQIFNENIVGSEGNKQLSIAPSKLQEFVAKVNEEFEKHAMEGILPVLLTSPTLRPLIRSVIERFRPSLTVLSQNEIYPKAKIKTVGQI